MGRVGGGKGGSAAVGSPTGAAGEERGKECSRGIAHRRCLGRGGGVDCSRGIAHGRRRRGGKVERSRGIAHWRSRGRVEGRRAAVGRPTGAAKEGRCVRGRGQGGRGQRGGPPVRGTFRVPAPLDT